MVIGDEVLGKEVFDTDLWISEAPGPADRGRKTLLQRIERRRERQAHLEAHRHDQQRRCVNFERLALSVIAARTIGPGVAMSFLLKLLAGRG